MMKEYQKINKIKGELSLPGDKSVSHRAVIFGSMAKGKSVITNCSNGEDVKSSISCFRQLGCSIESKDGQIIIEGKGKKGFNKPNLPLDAGNSGTTSRLISGMLCAQDFETTIVGDESLSKRPMDRVVDPLAFMGAKIEATNHRLPLKIYPSYELKAVEHILKVPSAQVKSAIILAGLHLDDTTTVVESVKTRNHSEKMLGLEVEEKGSLSIIKVSSKNYPIPQEYNVPADISSAAFFIVFALLSEDSELILRNVLLNETRAGLIKVLKKMGGNIEIIAEHKSGEEISGDLLIKSSKLHNIEIDKEIIPNIIDEIPILSIAGLFAEGRFEIKNAEELRLKETDRINAMVSNFHKLGVKTEESIDGFCVEGNVNDVCNVYESFGDHRIAMSFSILSMLLKNGGKIDDFDCVNISNPNFINQINSIVR